MRVWERGSGETLACGSGACAVLAVCQKKGLVDSIITAELPGGKLQLSFDQNKQVLMTGSATEVFSGEWQSILNEAKNTYPSQINKFSPEDRSKKAA